MTNEEAYKKGRKDALEEIENLMYHKSFEEDSDLQKWDGGCWFRYKLFEDALDEVRSYD